MPAMSVKKISLTAQIAEVDRELVQRKDTYARLVATRKLRESHANFQMAHMQAVRDTLAWLLENENLIKHRLAQ
jgi:hypothetical protein